jgi:hypothetical protein
METVAHQGVGLCIGVLFTCACEQYLCFHTLGDVAAAPEPILGGLEIGGGIECVVIDHALACKAFEQSSDFKRMPSTADSPSQSQAKTPS